MPRQHLDGTMGVFLENLHITGLESKLFFTGGKMELAQITGGKDINPYIYIYIYIGQMFDLNFLVQIRLLNRPISQTGLLTRSG